MVGALFGTLGVLIFSIFISSEILEANISESRLAFKYVILISSGIVIIVGILVWFFLKMNDRTEQESTSKKITLVQVRDIMRLPSVWLLMIIILCGYVGYKITDVFALYAENVMLYNQVESAKVGAFLLFARPIVGVFIGVIADRTQITFWLIISFVISFLGA